MKLALLLGAATLATSAAGFAVPEAMLPLSSILQDSSLIVTEGVDTSTRETGVVKVVATADWASNVARGRKLMAAMKGTDTEAAKVWEMGDTAQSTFDGNLIKEVQQWGWNNQPPKVKANMDKQCDSVEYHKADVNGGANKCLSLEHWGDPFVKKLFGRLPPIEDQGYIACGKAELLVTGGYHRIAVNAAGGNIMALDRKSPAHSAADLWGRSPKDYELPAIRSASDITWGFWNWVTTGGNIKSLKYFFNCLIVIPETQDLIRQVHEKLTPPRS